MKRLLTVGCLAALALAGCVVLPVEGPGHDHHYREYRGYGHYDGPRGAPYYYRRENAGYRR